jgi:hypothetical protein
MPASDKQENQHQDRVSRALLHQAGEVVHVLAQDAFAAQCHDYNERAQVHERVDHHVHRDALEAGAVPRDQAQQHVAGV